MFDCDTTLFFLSYSKPMLNMSKPHYGAWTPLLAASPGKIIISPSAVTPKKMPKSVPSFQDASSMMFSNHFQVFHFSMIDEY